MSVVSITKRTLYCATLAFILSVTKLGAISDGFAQAPTPAQIDRNGALILIRSSLIALDQANKTSNYTVLRELGAPGFQTNTPERLAGIFASWRRDNLDLSGVAVLEPQLSLLPQIEANGMLHMAGFFPSVPKQVNFDLGFMPVNRQWRLFQIGVTLGQAAPMAPDAPTQGANAPATSKQPPSSAKSPSTPPTGTAK